MPRRSRPDPDLPTLVSIETAHAAGLTTDQVRQRVRSGEWLRVGRGWYLRESIVSGLAGHDRELRLHQFAAVAAAHRVPGSAVCGPSAAVLHGMPVLRIPSDVHLIAPSGGWTGQRAGLRLHEWILPPEHVAIAPLPITTPARTWVDLGRVDGTTGAVVAGDHLLRAGLAARSDFARALEEMGTSQLLHRPRNALPLLDALRETPLESASACYFEAHRLPRPQWQVDVHDRDGFVGRVDCCWDGGRIVGEADGRLKYVTGDDLYREKRREDRLRATGREVIRWGWIDLRDPRLARRIAAALGNPTASVTRGPFR